MRPSTADLARIGFVTSRYKELRGLHLAVWGGLMTLYLAVSLIANRRAASERDALDGMVFVLCVCVPAGFAQAYLRQYYNGRFGRVGDDEEVDWDAGMLIAIGFAVTMLAFERWSHPGTLFLAWVVLHLWIVIRDHPYRWHHLIGMAGALAAFSVAATGRSSPLVQELRLLLFSAGLSVVGFLDHKLLVDALGGSSRRDAPERLDLEAQADSQG